MAEKEESPPVPPPMQCSSCRAELPADAGFCTACGTAVTAARPGRRGRRPATDAETRRAARNEFGRIKSVVLTVRSIFWASAVVATLHVLVAFLLAKAWTGDAEYEWVATFLKYATVGELAMMLAGALLVLRSPLVWTTVAACYWTLMTAGGLWLTDFDFSPIMLARLFLTASFWFAVVQAGRVEKLMALDPSLQIVRKRLDPSRRVVGGVADQAAARRRAQGARERAARWQLFGGIAAGLLVVGLVLWQLLKPPAVDATLVAFRQQWTKSDAGAIRAMFRDVGQRGAAGWVETMERRGWLQAMPYLEEPKVTPRGAVVDAVFASRVGDIATAWHRDESRWQLVGIELPKFEFPDHAAAIDLFRRAWAAEGTKPLVELLRPDSRDRTGASLVRILERRGWQERRPALGECAPGRPGDGRIRLRFRVADGELTVAMEYWHPSWAVTSVSLPRE